MSFEERGFLSNADDCPSLDRVIEPMTLFNRRGDQSLIHLGPQAATAAQLPASAAERVMRAFDFLFALTVLIAAAPAILLIVLVLQIDSPGAVLFVQQRVGRNGVMFPCIKLRTMVTNAAERLEEVLSTSAEARNEWDKDHKLRNDPRVTRIGRLARLFSLDELPQLVNILMGHMSVVGPRPIVEAEIWRYGPGFADYCSVRPGLTGLWQVSGRNDVTYEERVRLDRQYARNKSIVFDLQIIARTFSAVLFARGAR